MDEVTVIGGGLAGCEAAWMLARQGVPVNLVEMRPVRSTEVHRTGNLAELVCSNSLKAISTERAPGLLKEELRLLGSLLLQAADETQVPAGGALAVDRERFSQAVEERIEGHPGIRIERSEVTELPDAGLTILATGPHTSQALQEELRRVVPFGTLRFSLFGAASGLPILPSLPRCFSPASPGCCCSASFCSKGFFFGASASRSITRITSSLVSLRSSATRSATE